MDDFQAYQQAIQQSLSAVEQPKVELPEGPEQTPAQLVGSTVLEGFGTDFLREGISETKDYLKKRALNTLGFSDEEAENISKNGLKGLKDVVKSRAKQALGLEDFTDEEVRKGLLSRSNINPDDAENILSNLKDPEQYQAKFKSQFPESDLTDEEIENTRVAGLKKYASRGRKLISDEAEELPKLELPKVSIPEMPDVAPAMRVIADVEGLQRPKLPELEELGQIREIPKPPVQIEGLSMEDRLKNLQQGFKTEMPEAPELSMPKPDLPELQTPTVSSDIAEAKEAVEQSAKSAIEKATSSVAEKAGKTALTEAGELAGEEAGEIAGEGALDALLGPAGIVLGLGTMIGGLFLHKKHHSSPAPVEEPRINPSVQYGILP